LRKRPRPKLGCGDKERRRMSVIGHYECGLELSGPIKGGKFLDQLIYYFHFKKNSDRGFS
jgi:hypothetical protein